MSHESVSATFARLNPHYVVARSPAERKASVRPELDDALELMLKAA